MDVGMRALITLMLAVTPASRAADIPLCPGLTIVTAVNSIDGDYESIKTIESVTADRVRLKYSVEAPNNDPLGGPDLIKYDVYRSLLTKDLRSATLYEQVFSPHADEMIPETTAIGTSAAVLHALKTKGQADIGLSNAYGGVNLTGDRKVSPNAYDYMSALPLKRVGSVKLPVIVNGQRVELPTIHAAGESVDGEKNEFFFLDDEKNPLSIKFRLGVGSVPAADAAQREQCDATKKMMAAQHLLGDPQVIKTLDQMGCNRTTDTDRDVLRVVKITYRCGGAPMQQDAGGAGEGAAALEQQLEKNRRADIYSIYFSFNSDVLRPESEPTLKEIAGVMQKHPDWTLSVNGHTDNIAGDAYNLTLSQKRAAAVKNALVKKYHIDANRLLTNGFGKSQPKDTNDTIEGRARNRRVELVRM